MIQGSDHGYQRYEVHQLRYQSLLELLNKKANVGTKHSTALRHLLRTSVNVASNGQAGHQNGERKNGFKDDKPPPGSFLDCLEHETRRVARFVAAEADALWMRLLDAAQSFTAQQGNSGEMPAETCRNRCDSIGEGLIHLDTFIRRNVAAAAQLAETCDSGNTFPILPADGFPDELDVQDPIYVTCLRHCVLGSVSLEPILVGLSDMYEKVRELETNVAVTNCTWVPPARFVRATTKFWVQPMDATRLKCEIIKHMPLSIFGQREKLTEDATGKKTAFYLRQDRKERVKCPRAVICTWLRGIMEPYATRFMTHAAARPGMTGLRIPVAGSGGFRYLHEERVSDWTCISSLYFDDPELQTYDSRLRRLDGAQVVRIRWYGPRSNKPDHQVWLERKVHREPWTRERSYKERCSLQQCHVQNFVTGRAQPEEVAAEASDVPLLQSVQTFLTDNGQVPVMRTVCNRSAFQESSNALVRISLDTHLHMLRELDAPHAPGDWCRDLSAPSTEADVVHFPYCVAEVKLQVETPPPWLQALISGGLLVPAPRFSKLLHGVATLFPDTISSLPYWFLQNIDGMYFPATFEEMADTSDPYAKEAAPWLFPAVNQLPLAAYISDALKRRLSKQPSSPDDPPRPMLTAYTPAPPPPTPVTCPSSEPGTPDCDEEVQQRQSSGSAGSADAPLHDGPLRRVTEEGPGKSSPASLSSPRAEAEMQGGDQDRSATAPLGNGISHERVQHGGQDEYSSGHMAWLAAAPGVGTQKGEASVTPGGAITPHHSETGVAPPERGAALPASARSTASAAASPGTTGTFPSYQTAVRPAQPESSSGSTCSSMSRPASANAAGQAQTSCASGCATMLQPSTSMFDAKSVSAVAAVPPLPLMSQRQHETEPPGDKSQLPCTTEMPGGPATQPARPELVPLAPSGGVWQGPMPQGPVEGSQAAMTMEAGAAVTRYPTPLLQGPAQRSGAGGMIDAGAANARSPTPDGELLLLPPSPTAISPSKADAVVIDLPADPPTSAPASRFAKIGRFLRGKRGQPSPPPGELPTKSTSGVAGYRAKAMVRTRVEPKTFFANERTFLAWLQISVLIMFMALSLLSGSSLTQGGVSGSTGSSGCSGCSAGKYAGIIIAPVAALFMIYAFYMYKKRTIQILRRDKVRYDDQKGPIMLVIILIAATLTAFVLTAQAALH